MAKGPIQCRIDPFALFACQVADNSNNSYIWHGYGGAPLGPPTMKHFYVLFGGETTQTGKCQVSISGMLTIPCQ